MSTKKALITGITGQDGSYLAELLLAKGYEVHGMIRRSCSFNTGRIEHLYQDPHEDRPRLFLHYGDLTDASSLNQILRTIQPDEIYNLGAQSHVRVTFDMPEYTAESPGWARCGCSRRSATAGLAHPLLPGLVQRDVRRGGGDPADRDDAVLPAQPLRRRQGLRALHHARTTARPTASSPATASCSTTSRRAGARPS